MSRYRPGPFRSLLAALLLAALASSALSAQTARRTRVFPVPVAGYAPETSLMLGAAVVGVVSQEPAEAPRRPSTAVLTAIYTLKNQYLAELALDHWTPGNAWHLTGYLGVERYPSRFHGIGSQSTDTSEVYTPQLLILLAGAQRQIARHLYAGASYGLRHARMVETAAGGRLAPGTIPGSRGGTEAILTAQVEWDSRDALYRTRSGTYLRLAFGVAGGALGGEHPYRRYTADARWFRGLGEATVLAAQVVVDATDGTVPFDQLPRLSGSAILRGYTVPRYVDGAVSAGQVELRAPLRGIVSWVLFGGAGATGASVRALPDATWRAAGGAGIRLLLDRNNGLQLRFDYALAAEGGAFYVSAGDAF